MTDDARPDGLRSVSSVSARASINAIRALSGTGLSREEHQLREDLAKLPMISKSRAAQWLGISRSGLEHWCRREGVAWVYTEQSEAP